MYVISCTISSFGISWAFGSVRLSRLNLLPSALFSSQTSKVNPNPTAQVPIPPDASENSRTASTDESRTIEALLHPQTFQQLAEACEPNPCSLKPSTRNPKASLIQP